MSLFYPCVCRRFQRRWRLYSAIWRLSSFFATLSAIIGFVWKAVLGEPADSNLQNPLLTIGAYCGCIAMMLLAVFLSTKLKTKRALLAKMVTDANMQTATVGCLIAGIVLFVIAPLLPGGNGSFISAINQVNRFFPMAIILGVIHTIRRSGGTRSISLPILLAAGFSLSIGILGFSKEGMLTPFLCWIVAAASQRYKVSRTQIACSVLATVFIFRYLVPYAQYGRSYRAESDSGNLNSQSLCCQTSDMCESVPGSLDRYLRREVAATATTTTRRGSSIVLR